MNDAILSPLEKLKSRVLVIDGLSHKVIIEKSDRGGHSAGMNTALTGRNNKIVDPAEPLHSLATGISLDQYLAGKIGGQTKLRSKPLEQPNHFLTLRKELWKGTAKFASVGILF